MKPGIIKFVGDKMTIEDDPESTLPEVSPGQRERMETVYACINAYLKAARNLIDGQYSSAKHFVPRYLIGPTCFVVICSDECVAVRFALKTPETKNIIAWSSDTIAEIASLLSQKLIQVHSSRHFTEQSDSGIVLTLQAKSADSSEPRPITTVKYSINAVLELPKQLPNPPLKPFSLFSVRNEFDVGILIETLSPAGNAAEKAQKYLIRGSIRSPAGWECVELYPGWDPAMWKPEHAPIWAERDVLAAIVTAQTKKAQFDALDPKRSAREQFGQELSEFRSLLNSNPGREETLHQFLKERPHLLCPTRVEMWSKLALGARETDFVFRQASGEYFLVEIEKSTHELFRQDGQVRTELVHAQKQVSDWFRYVEDNLKTVQQELGLAGISSTPNALIVMGRSRDLTPENRRALTTMRNLAPKIQIMTYDDVFDSAKAVVENLFGPMWDQPGGSRIYQVSDGQKIPGMPDLV